MSIFRHLLLLISVVSLLCSCTRKVEDNKIKISLPSSVATKVSGERSSKVNVLNSSPFGLGSETNLLGINCFMITVGAANTTESEFKKNKCWSSSSTQQIYFGDIITGLKRGVDTEVELSIKQGSKRIITLWGMQADASSCDDIYINSNAVNGWTKPRRLASSTIDLNQPEQILQMNLPTVSDISSRYEIEECEIEGVTNAGGSNTSVSFYGTGQDGIFDLSGQNSVNLSTAVDGTTGRVYSAHRRIQAIDVSGKTVTLGSPTITAADFEIGDEVLWHVSASWDSTPSAGCGSDIFNGSFGFAEVTSISASDVTLDNPITNDPSFNTNLAQNTRDGSVAFCAMQLVRVPNFQGIFIDQNTNLYVDPFDLQASSGSGGILAFRVQEAIEIQSFDLSLDVKGRGFNDTTNSGQGTSYSGFSQNHSDQAANYGGGGNDSAADGAGGGAGAGSANGGHNSLGGGGGLAPSFCSGPCFPVQDFKMFFGSQGGGVNPSFAGGAGGGISILHISQINGTTGTFKVNADAQPGLNTDTGGGGGGTIHLSLGETMTDVLLQSRGGDGIEDAGSGGGGVVEAKYCVDPSTALTILDSGGSVTTGQPGQIGDVVSALESALCE